MFYVNTWDLKGIKNYDSLILLKQGCCIGESSSELERQTSAITRHNLHLRVLLLIPKHLFLRKRGSNEGAHISTSPPPLQLLRIILHLYLKQPCIARFPPPFTAPP